MHWAAVGGGGTRGRGGTRVPGDGLDYQAVVAAMSRTESGYENEVGIIDWVGKVFIPAYWLKGSKQSWNQPRNKLLRRERKHRRLGGRGKTQEKTDLTDGQEDGGGHQRTWGQSSRVQGVNSGAAGGRTSQLNLHHMNHPNTFHVESKRYQNQSWLQHLHSVCGTVWTTTGPGQEPVPQRFRFWSAKLGQRISETQKIKMSKF